MAKPFQVTISPADGNSTLWGDNLAVINEGDTWITNGASTTDGFGHTVRIENVGGGADLDGNTITIYGTDWDGNSINETITGPAAPNGVVNTTGYFNIVTSVVYNGGDIGVVVRLDIGTNSDAQTNPYPIDWAKNQLEVDVSTEMEGYSVQYSRSPNYDSTPETSIQNIPSDEWIWVDWVATVSGVYQLLYAPVRIRFNLTEYTSGQTLTFCASQSRLT